MHTGVHNLDGGGWGGKSEAYKKRFIIKRVYVYMMWKKYK